MRGLIFDIKEFALNDGEGIRTTVFFKGCPLRCIWCHNPEGLSPSPEIYEKQNGCLHCELCRKPCNHPECQPFKRCLHICPKNLIHVAGTEWEAKDLAEKLLKKTGIFEETKGGITLSGGEPLLQPDFAAELLSLLKGKVSLAIETSGFTTHENFKKVISLCDFVYMDLKIFDEEAHKKYTGVSNEQILENAKWLKESKIPHTFRTPLIPGITDTEENLKTLSEFIGNDSWEKLPYNTLAGAKYKGVGRKYLYELPKETDAIDG